MTTSATPAHEPRRPRMVRVYWKARIHPEDLVGRPWWGHCQNEIWWVLPVCKHWDDPSERRSKRDDGPTMVPCYECPTKGPIEMREDA